MTEAQEEAARIVKEPPIIEMVLHCPDCAKQHIDHSGWEKRLHRTHLCEYCGKKWRPCDIPTIGVKALRAEEEPEPSVWPLKGTYSTTTRTEQGELMVTAFQSHTNAIYPKLEEERLLDALFKDASPETRARLVVGELEARGIDLTAVTKSQYFVDAVRPCRGIPDKHGSLDHGKRIFCDRKLFEKCAEDCVCAIAEDNWECDMCNWLLKLEPTLEKAKELLGGSQGTIYRLVQADKIGDPRGLLDDAATEAN